MTVLDAPHSAPAPIAHVALSLPERSGVALERAVEALFQKQHDDGHWCAELEGDSILSSEFLLMKAALGLHRAPIAAGDDLRLFDKLCAHMRLLQRQDGTWGQYPGSPPDLSATVKAYFALKLFGGDHPDDAHMARAREAVLDLGGAEEINTFSTFYLACLGQVSWDACPNIPPEIALLPKWFPFHLNKCASWTRTLIVPLAICSALRPVRRVPGHLGIGELFRDHSRKDTLRQRREAPEPGTWSHLFVTLDGVLKTYQRTGVTPVRQRAIEACRRWIDQRSNPAESDGLGAIFPPLVYIQIAYDAMGLGRDNATRQQCEHEIARWVIEKDDHARVQPCFSPVWDTGIALYALTEAGRTVRTDPRIERTCAWLRSKEVRITGDWIDNLRPADRPPMRPLEMGPGGTCAAWAFEYLNEWSPDADDTAMIAKALRRAGDRPADQSAERAHDRSAATPGAGLNHDASRRATDWLLRMQNDDGGWAAFDRTRHRDWMEAVPFADHNAMQDPSCADITGRTVESLITCGVERDHPAIRSAVEYILREQKPFGGWFGRWGVNYLYGSWQALGGLAHAGAIDPASPAIRRAEQWLRSVQHESGGFGENANSYLDGEAGDAWIGRGEPTASQTAWGAMSLMYIVGAHDPAVERAVAWLCDTQLDRDTPADFPEHPVDEPAGSWREAEFTGTGFPRVFYLRYHLYRHYFPIMALARYRNLLRTIKPGNTRTSGAAR